MPKHPGLMACFGMSALPSAKAIAHSFRSERTGALFAGLAAHSVLRLDQTLSGAFGLLMGVLAHAVGWPFHAVDVSLLPMRCAVIWQL
jgi:phytoene dehydrogenase-like protein